MTNIDCFHVGAKLLIVNPDKKLLLLKRNHPTKKIYWDLPGGRVHRGETVREALFREVKEETGLEIIEEINPFTTVLTDIRIKDKTSDVGLIFSIFYTELSCSFEPNLSDEHVYFEWLTLTEAAMLLKPCYPAEFIEKLLIH